MAIPPNLISDPARCMLAIAACRRSRVCVTIRRSMSRPKASHTALALAAEDTSCRVRKVRGHASGCFRLVANASRLLPCSTHGVFPRCFSGSCCEFHVRACLRSHGNLMCRPASTMTCMRVCSVRSCNLVRRDLASVEGPKAQWCVATIHSADRRRTGVGPCLVAEHRAMAANSTVGPALPVILATPELAVSIAEALGLWCSCRLAAISLGGARLREALPRLADRWLRLVAIGGEGPDGASRSSCESFSVAEGRWRLWPARLQERRAGCAAAVLDGQLYVVGGDGSDFETLATMERLELPRAGLGGARCVNVCIGGRMSE